ncbi:MAG: 3-hydroxyacyl-CoA dehydrogenase family protein [Deltaproteobacteria bacterium]|nr:3-hydroxyacyl-CoA dehydrogenase family protein [Deltaproteobacteria bacterium]MBW1930986.1 3-hydroxyacyl-CoA dehydrogenase family protein [Deltaproteobacteria bacterium]MBW2026504.1 3-hydroxyacyl-CoA dehydrogenase family protein [Deltaproteobacteria bacterium]
MEGLNKVGVVGAGMMGAEIALCFAMSGYEVYMKDATLELAQKGKDRLEGVLDKAIQKGRFQAKDKAPTLNRIIPTDKNKSFKDVDLVVEAVFEDLKIKKEVFSQLDSICKSDCVFATNTSSISITLLATSVRPERIGRFLGAHFFSPASVMKLVEVIPGLETEEETVAFMMDCCRKIGKTPIRVKDVTGFAVNRILHAMWIEANRLVEEGVATPEDIDTACKLGLGHPIGPYALMDLTGNDLNLKVQEILYETYGERFRPRPILKQKVNANHLGRKTGRGWYEYKK